MTDLKEDSELPKLWLEYQSKNKYAKNIEYIDTLYAVEKIIKILEQQSIMV